MSVVCASCGKRFEGRKDAKTCSDRCRKRVHRAQYSYVLPRSPLESIAQSGVEASSSLKPVMATVHATPGSVFTPATASYEHLSQFQIQKLKAIEHQENPDLKSVVPTSGRSRFPWGILVLLLLLFGSSGFAIRGYIAKQGPAGSEGQAGIAGAPGATGLQGSAGTTGLPGPSGERGVVGLTGANGATGSVGATGAQGASGIAACPNGDCLSLQVATPGVAETGNINISGTVIAGALQGNGANLTSLNASNISSGTLSDARLSTNIALLNGTGPQTFTGNNKFTGTLLHQNAIDSSSAFQIQNAAGSTVLGIDTSANRVLFGTASTLSGIISLHNSTNSNTVSLTSGTTGSNITLTLPTALPSSNNYCLAGSTAGVLSFLPCGAGSTATVTLVPEFPGAVLTGDGTSNTGTMTSDFCSGSSRQNLNTGVCTVSTESHNYYSWTANATNDYDVWVRWQVPTDFSTFSSASFNGWRTSSSDSVTVSIYNNSASSCDSAGISGTVATWNSASLAAIGSCTPSAGDVLNIRVQLSVGVNAEFARVGEITLTYNRK